MSLPSDVQDRLTCVANLLARPGQLDGVRIRCCAELLRTAVERSVARACGAGNTDRPVHALLISLPSHVDADVAHDASQLWHALSRAIRHHGYELTPTVAELTGWHADTASVAASLGPALTLSGNIDLT
ncbi:hypothetical protein SAMN04488074_12514 [Lentzea albidocapillata subsp. violacea]|uniref:Uncharacterized protein n=1 Tax=Lentzea albidocapillata subsp. violacea TaxID=128104 RepID=A0A1G9V4R7_9PSEU|nr:hypothetical protein [Lentzea albidocapillata]SDM67046.1 hypothetical protein SAMN04488074_12514 [Lentzea albidocapillata subsp. violacea]